MAFSQKIDDAPYPLVSDEIAVRRFVLGVSLLNCASQLGATVTARTYDRIRRIAGALPRVVDDLAQHYGLYYDEIQVSITPISLIGHSLSAHDLAAVASAVDAAARDTGVDSVYGFSSVGPIDAQLGATSLADALPFIIASTERVHASVDYSTLAGGVHLPAATAYSRAVREIGNLSATTHNHFLRVAGACYSPNTLLFHDVRKPDVVASVEVSCLSEVVNRIDAQDGEWDLREINRDIQQIARRQYRAARLITDRFAERMTQRSGTRVWNGQAIVTTAPAGRSEERDQALAALRRLSRGSASAASLSVAAAAVDRDRSGARLSAHLSPADVVEDRDMEVENTPTAGTLGVSHDLAFVGSDADTDEIRHVFVEHALSNQNHGRPFSIVLLDADGDGNIHLPGFGVRSMNEPAG